MMKVIKETCSAN